MYHIIEIQTYSNDNSVIVTPISSSANENTAESIFHQKMAVAAVSSVPVHSVVMLNEEGNLMLKGFYKHESTTTEE